jgi:putative transposase
LVDKILGVWTENPAWGYRKLGRYLQRNGFPSATEKRVRLIYQRLGIHGVSPVFRTTRQPKGKCLKHPYLLRGKKIRFSNQVWETDITYIRLPGGMVYLTAFIDVYSRRILSWSLGRTMESGLCVDALHEAVMNHGKPLFHTASLLPFSIVIPLYPTHKVCGERK